MHELTVSSDNWNAYIIERAKQTLEDKVGLKYDSSHENIKWK